MANLAVLGGTPVGAVKIPSWPIHGEEEEREILEVVKSGKWASYGPKQEAFEKAFSEYTGAKHSMCVTNGSHALRVSLEALGIGPGDEVILPGNTWKATALAVLDVNAVPVIVDIELDTMNICPKAAEAAITPKTRAIIPVHLWGRMCDMDAIMALAAKYGLFVVEDCAHQHGSRWRDVNAGAIGDAGAFSLQDSKQLTTGEGGMVTAKDDRVAANVRSLTNSGRNYGWPPMTSGNFRFTEFQAAIGLCQLARIDEQNKLREKNALWLEPELEKVGGLKALYRNPAVTFQSYYGWTLSYDAAEWGGVSKWAVMKAVGEETGCYMSSVFMPLLRSNLYRIFNKKTHKLSDEYVAAIDPRRFAIPVCDKVYDEIAVNFFHTCLLMSQADNQVLVDGFAKVKANIDELRTFAKDYKHRDNE
jgi:L-glutamine:2-deoxy-scyllo-inosose/3-amino-2,3-dideoxy-scyllo-inosose aminotransferase